MKRFASFMATLAVILVVALAVGWLAVNEQNAATTLPTSPSGAPVAEQGVPAEATEAIVEYVHDGDTLFLADGRKVRLLGIDTPEIGKNLACYGPEATEILRSLLPEGSRVWVLSDIEPLDQYGRSLLFIYNEAGVNVNIAMLEAGAAQVEMYSPNYLFRDEIEHAEREAQDAGAGLWGQCR